MYFSLTHARSIIDIARLFGMKGGRVLDYGCGPGYLSRQLAISRFNTTGIEHSAASAESANLRLEGLECWNGCYTTGTLPESLARDAFEWVFSVEAYEHLREEWIPEYFLGIRKYLKKNGYLLITTPNEENLDDNLVVCPCCESKFHRWGHLRSVSSSSLRQLAESFGFEVLLCHGIDLAHAQNLRVSMADRVVSKLRLGGRTVRKIPSDMASIVMALIRNIRKCEKKPHLILIARKIGE